MMEEESEEGSPAPPPEAPRRVTDTVEDFDRHAEGVTVGEAARFDNNPPIARVISEPPPDLASLGSSRGGVRVTNSLGPSQPAGQFKYDSAKPWYMFGRGQVDKTGLTGGPAWVPDAACSQCTTCRANFDFFNRRHHCRHCGKIFCGGCSSKYKLLPVSFGVREPQRVCTDCAIVLEPIQAELASSISNSTRDLSFNMSDSATYLGNPLSFSMSAEIKKACQSVHNFFGSNPNSTIVQDQYIPSFLLRNAKGIAFLSVIKAGFVFAGRFGTGLVVGKDRQGSWTAPSAIGLAGMSWGAQIGFSDSDFVIILNTEASVDAFSGKAQVALGAQLNLAVGPLGRTGEASMNVNDDGAVAPCYTYSQSKGLFVGISLEGSTITERADVNDRFYGIHHDPKELLSGRVQRPNAAQPLYEALHQACSNDVDNI